MVINFNAAEHKDSSTIHVSHLSVMQHKLCFVSLICILTRETLRIPSDMMFFRLWIPFIVINKIFWPQVEVHADSETFNLLGEMTTINGWFPEICVTIRYNLKYMYKYLVLYLMFEEFPGKEHALLICNHRSDIDWLVGWVLAQVLIFLNLHLTKGCHL